MITLSLDLALANTGWCIFKNDDLFQYQTFENPKITSDVMHDLSFRFKKMMEFIDAAFKEFDINQVIIERPHGARDAKSARAQGVCASICGYISHNYITPDYVGAMEMKTYLNNLNPFDDEKDPKKKAIKYAELMAEVKFDSDHSADAYLIWACYKKRPPF